MESILTEVELGRGGKKDQRQRHFGDSGSQGQDLSSGQAGGLTFETNSSVLKRAASGIQTNLSEVGLYIASKADQAIAFRAMRDSTLWVRCM